MTIKELITKYRYNMKQLSDRFGIPYRTIQNWVGGQRECADYIINMMDEILEREDRNMIMVASEKFLAEGTKERLMKSATRYEEFDAFVDETGYEDWMDEFVENPEEDMLKESDVNRINKILKEIWDMVH